MFIINTVALWVIISVSINNYLMTLPIPVIRKKDFPTTYIIQHENRIDFQKDNARHFQQLTCCVTLVRRLKEKRYISIFPIKQKLEMYIQKESVLF
ncbi:hypothetical protein [Solibacillus isronensis]|uniref:hypothetical protein n=1 Tax=Solibacillus isronensis TaxID=412383 RepID=UPI002040A334|nr:hypothetical protein [Solibacillus isronensis]MCM3721088.1 hypothetical protein [Solibacillus isronensis]